MAVLDTNTFSLQDVVDEINPTTDDLQDCINDAIEGNYDPNYYTAPATSLLEFRNYGGEQYWGYTAGTQSTTTNICSLSLTETIYQQHPTGQAFDFNDPIYSDTSGTLAPAGWWKVSILYRYWTGSAWSGSTLSC